MHLGTKDNEKILFQDFLTIENADSDLKVHALHHSNELLVRFRLSFQKLLQTNRINKRLSKTGFDYDFDDEKLYLFH